MQKKLTACLLALMLVCAIGYGQAAQTQGRELVVANPTKVSGMFLSDRLSNNTSDIDVRALLHGLGTVAYLAEDQQIINPAWCAITSVRWMIRAMSPIP